MHTEVILVDENDNQIGVEEKMKAHQEGKLHRAFSVFVFNSKKELLLQKRAAHKYHSGGLWTNTCCGHPRPGETILEAAHKRLKEEMGFDCELKEVSSFVYKVALGRGLSEHEFDHVLVGIFNSIPVLNKEEADDFQWVSLEAVKRDVKNNPQKYSYWFPLALEKLP